MKLERIVLAGALTTLFSVNGCDGNQPQVPPPHESEAKGDSEKRVQAEQVSYIVPYVPTQGDIRRLEERLTSDPLFEDFFYGVALFAGHAYGTSQHEQALEGRSDITNVGEYLRAAKPLILQRFKDDAVARCLHPFAKESIAFSDNVSYDEKTNKKAAEIITVYAKLKAAATLVKNAQEQELSEQDVKQIVFALEGIPLPDKEKLAKIKSQPSESKALFTALLSDLEKEIVKYSVEKGKVVFKPDFSVAAQEYVVSSPLGRFVFGQTRSIREEERIVLRCNPHLAADGVLDLFAEYSGHRNAPVGDLLHEIAYCLPDNKGKAFLFMNFALRFGAGDLEKSRQQLASLYLTNSFLNHWQLRYKSEGKGFLIDLLGLIYVKRKIPSSFDEYYRLHKALASFEGTNRKEGEKPLFENAEEEAKKFNEAVAAVNEGFRNAWKYTNSSPFRQGNEETKKRFRDAIHSLEGLRSILYEGFGPAKKRLFSVWLAPGSIEQDIEREMKFYWRAHAPSDNVRLYGHDEYAKSDPLHAKNQLEMLHPNGENITVTAELLYRQFEKETKKPGEPATPPKVLELYKVTVPNGDSCAVPLARTLTADEQELFSHFPEAWDVARVPLCLFGEQADLNEMTKLYGLPGDVIARLQEKRVELEKDAATSQPLSFQVSSYVFDSWLDAVKGMHKQIAIIEEEIAQSIIDRHHAEQQAEDERLDPNQANWQRHYPEFYRKFRERAAKPYGPRGFTAEERAADRMIVQSLQAALAKSKPVTTQHTFDIGCAVAAANILSKKLPTIGEKIQKSGRPSLGDYNALVDATVNEFIVAAEGEVKGERCQIEKLYALAERAHSLEKEILLNDPARNNPWYDKARQITNKVFSFSGFVPLEYGGDALGIVSFGGDVVDALDKVHNEKFSANLRTLAGFQRKLDERITVELERVGADATVNNSMRSLIERLETARQTVTDSLKDHPANSMQFSGANPYAIGGDLAAVQDYLRKWDKKYGQLAKDVLNDFDGLRLSSGDRVKDLMKCQQVIKSLDNELGRIENMPEPDRYGLVQVAKSALGFFIPYGPGVVITMQDMLTSDQDVGQHQRSVKVQLQEYRRLARQRAIELYHEELVTPKSK